MGIKVNSTSKKERSKKKIELSIDKRDRWSGGGHVVLDNIIEAVAADERISINFECTRGLRLVITNKPSMRDYIKGGYVYMPQNSWAWIGPWDREKGLIFKRLMLIIMSRFALMRASHVIRLSESIPHTVRSSILPNVLDTAFDDIKTKSEKEFRIGGGGLYMFGGSISYRNQLSVASYLNSCGYLEKENKHLTIRTYEISKVELKKTIYLGKSCSKITVISKRCCREKLLSEAKCIGLVIFSSLAEASPISLLEVQSLGIPFLTTNIPGYTQHQIDSSRVYDPKQLETLVEKLENPLIWKYTDEEKEAYCSAESIKLSKSSWGEQFRNQIIESSIDRKF